MSDKRDFNASNKNSNKWPFVVVLIYVTCALLFVRDEVTIRYHIADAFFILFFLFNIFAYRDSIWNKSNIYAKSALLFSIYIFISSLWSPNSTFDKNLLLQSSLLINSVALFYLISKHRVVKAVLFGFVLYSFINNIIHLGIIPNTLFAPGEPYLYGGRFIGTGLNPNTLALDLFFGTFASLLLIQEQKKGILKVLLNLNILLILNTIISTGSKKGLISFIILILYYIFSTYFKNRSSKILNILSITLGLTMVFIFFGDMLISQYDISGRFSGMFNAISSGDGDESTSLRISFIKVGFEGFLNSPIFGHGQDAFAFYNYYYSHNNYIEILFNLGIIGFVLYYQIIVRLFRANRHSIYANKLIYLVLIIILLIDTALVSYNLRSHMIFFTLLSALVAPKLIRNGNFNYKY